MEPTEKKFNSDESTEKMTNYEMLLDDVRRFSYAKISNSIAQQISKWTDEECHKVIDKLKDEDYQMVYDMTSLKMLNGELQIFMENRAENEQIIKETILDKKEDGGDTGHNDQV